MKPIIVLLVMLATPATALACSEHDHAAAKPRAAAKSSARIEGTLREVDAERATVSLAHGPIPGLRMKRMESMVANVDPSIDLSHLKPGDAVRFRVKVGVGMPVVTEIDKTVMR